MNRGSMTRALLAGALALAGCKHEFSGLRETSNHLTFGIMRPVGTSAAALSASELSAYVTRALGPQAETRIYDSADALATALVSGELDAAWMTPGAYVRAADKVHLQPLLKLTRDGAQSYRSVLFTRAVGSPGALSRLQGGKLALVESGSMSGHLYPLALMRSEGIDPAKHFGQVLEGKNHAEVCQLVLDGKADVGATLSDDHPGREPVVDGCRQAGFDAAQFAIIERSEPIPNDVIATVPSMDAGLRERIRGSLLQLAATPDGKGELQRIFHADGFAPASDADFDGVRALQKTVGE